jgi:hypothetical protein
MSTTVTKRKLTLSKAKASPEGTKPVQAKGSVQVHVLPENETKTACGIVIGNWREQIELDADAKFNCPVCAEALKAQAKKAKAEAQS